MKSRLGEYQTANKRTAQEPFCIVRSAFWLPRIHTK